MNINPRSLYNKVDDLKLILEQYEADCVFISESWERQKIGLKKLLNLDNYEIITNVHQRENGGGKPAIIIRTDKYFVKPLSPDIITVPIGVEAVWALITPKILNPRNKIKQIAVCALYYNGPKSTKKKELYDHIAITYNLLLAKYGSNLHFCIAGDTNKLNLSPILNLSPSLQQVVKVPTRLNPDAILDKIITTMSKFYCPPVTKPPLQNDGKKGAPSDHLVVLMYPVSSELECPPRVYRTVQYRPLTDSGFIIYEKWLAEQTWAEIYAEKNCHKKAEIFQKKLLEKFEETFPIKTIKVCDEDKPWFSKSLKVLDRKRKREFLKNGKSEKWEILNQRFLVKVEDEKSNYYSKIVKNLKETNPSKWYSKVKRMTGKVTNSEENHNIEELLGKNDFDQREAIANHYATISQEYKSIKTDDFKDFLGSHKNESPPNIGPYKIMKTIKKMNKNASTVPGDLPIKLIHRFADELTLPLCHIINSCLQDGVYPEIWKCEIITPVPKVQPPEKMEHLRKIAGLMNFSKVMDKILAEYLIKDMAPTCDKAQYGNTEGLSVQHYLVKLIHQVLIGLDTNKKSESYAVIMSMIDWAQAFDRQSHVLGLQSFIDNGVRPSLIPILLSFFQDRRMRVKWKGGLSSEKFLPGGGPQGGLLGTLEYTSQSDGNTNFLTEKEKYKFIDDLSFLELLNLLMCGIASYNSKQHVPSDVGIDMEFIPAVNLKTQRYLKNISNWTSQNQMKLNAKKTNYMIFNFSTDHQFSTRLHIDGHLIEQVHQTKLLGVTISDDLKWHANTKDLVQRCYKRMIILRNLYSFAIPRSDLVNIYCLYIRSVAEQSSVVWSSSITVGESLDLERIQKVALRIILKDDYISYQNALRVTNLQSLEERRMKLLRKFAIKCTKHPRTSDMFPLRRHSRILRSQEVYEVTRARTD